jgi:APA family basic amino acid/polyamine antiporter
VIWVRHHISLKASPRGHGGPEPLGILGLTRRREHGPKFTAPSLIYKALYTKWLIKKLMEKMYFARKATGLIRDVTAKDAWMANIGFMGVGFAFLYITFGPALFPGVDMIYATSLAFIICLFVAIAYALMAASMPRTGGDYVWTSRIVHPLLGFIAGGIMWFNLTTWIGLGAKWIAVEGFSMLFWTLGSVFNNPGLQALSQFPTEVAIIISIVIVLLLTFLMLMRIKTTMWVSWGLTALIFLGLITYLVTLGSVGHENFIARLTELSGTSPTALITAARNAGYLTGITFSGIVWGIFFSILNFQGFVFSSYIGGEVKRPERSQVLAIIGSIFTFLIILLLFYAVSYAVIGRDLQHAMAYLAVSGNKAYPFPWPPYAHFLIYLASSNPIAITLVNLAFTLTIILCMIQVYLTSTRLMFAWAFDQVIPASLSSVSKRFGSPYKVTLIVSAIGIICVFLAYYTELLAFSAYQPLMYAIVAWFGGLSALLFPFKKKDVFSTAPPLARSKIGPIPVVSLFGLLVVITQPIIMVATVQPVMTGMPISIEYLIFIAILVIIAAVYFIISYLYNKRRGIDLSLAFREVPPL